MGQVTWRAADSLVEQVKRSAANSSRSVNEFITLVLNAATDPATADSESSAIRERLMLAGIAVAAPDPEVRRPHQTAVDAAAQRAATGSSLSGLIHESR